MLNADVARSSTVPCGQTVGVGKIIDSDDSTGLSEWNKTIHIAELLYAQFSFCWTYEHISELLIVLYYLALDFQNHV